ncbi:uncharacterized protein LOC119163155 [Rhipicephalus microplus]|uniref:uncharacterized protein LOC119163155 n=1 Tax=Rhipicephalus microplus TaxID=6941 RepID=UPI002376777A
MYKKILVPMILFYIAGETNTIRRCLPTRRRHRYSMKHFVNTSERIWTVRASMQTAIRCQFEQMRIIDPRAIFFNRTFLIRTQRVSIQLQGEFDPRHVDRMDVSALGMQAVSRETLVYEAPNSSCAVLELRLLSRDAACYYELRVKNSSIETVIHRECWRHFHNLTAQEIYVYTSECQHLVRPRM